MWIEISALDVWFFRDGRPFEAGEAHWVRSQFPPPPDTLLGATRAILLEALFDQYGGTLRGYEAWLTRGRPQTDPHDAVYTRAVDEYGVGTGVGKGYLRGPFIVTPDRYGRPHLRLHSPADVVDRLGGKGATTFHTDRLEPFVGDLGRSSWSETATLMGGLQPLAPRTAEDQEFGPVPSLTGEQLRRYLTRTAFTESIEKDGEPVKHETRVGIARDAAFGTARERHLYSADYLRPRRSGLPSAGTGIDGGRVALLVGTPDVVASQPGQSWRLPLGGEGRMAAAKAVAPGTSSAAGAIVEEVLDLLNPGGTVAQAVKQEAVRTGWLRIALLQPALFQGGWLPDAIELDGGEYRMRDLPFILQAATVGKPRAISGWDMSTRSPKPLRRAVPQGAVYYLQHDDAKGDRAADVQALIKRFHGLADGSPSGPGALQDDRAARAAGYGLAVVGACEPIATRQ